MTPILTRLYDQPKQWWCEHSTQPLPQGAYQIATFVAFYDSPGAAMRVFVNPSHKAIVELTLPSGSVSEP